MCAYKDIIVLCCKKENSEKVNGKKKTALDQISWFRPFF